MSKLALTSLAYASSLKTSFMSQNDQVGLSLRIKKIQMKLSSLRISVVAKCRPFQNSNLIATISFNAFLEETLMLKI